ncbi:MAG TPA: hypothetical protein VKZ18_12620 [Polyangia bacterium]|nr:hypothetical protein [Polyangia bacterium]
MAVCAIGSGCGAGLTAGTDGGAGHPASGGASGGGSGGVAGNGAAGAPDAGGGAGGGVTDNRPVCTAAFVQAAATASAPAAPAAGTCVVEPAGCRATCALPGCMVASDAVIRCADADLAQRGLRVAPAGSGTYVAATSDTETHLLLIGATSTGIDVGAPLSGQFGAPLMLAVDGTGTLHALGRQAGGTLAHAVQGAIGAFTAQAVSSSPDGGYSAGVAAFEVGPDGDPHALLGAGANAWSLARAESGHWTFDPPGPASNFTLDPSDAEITFGIASTDAGVLSLVARGGGTTWAGYPAENSADFRVTQAMAAPVAATLPPFAVAGYDGNALHLAWPAPAGPYTDLLIPNTAATSAGCVGAGTSGCTGTCVDQEYGIQGHPFSLGRTDDGAAWLGYLAIHVDRTCTRTIEVSDNEQFCTCLGTSDLSTGELHLLRGAPDGTQPVEALVLPLEPQSGSDLADDLPFISVRAFGTRVAVAARVQDSVRKLRVITLETGATP